MTPPPLENTPALPLLCCGAEFGHSKSNGTSVVYGDPEKFWLLAFQGHSKGRRDRNFYHRFTVTIGLSLVPFQGQTANSRSNFAEFSQCI